MGRLGISWEYESKPGAVRRNLSEQIDLKTKAKEATREWLFFPDGDEQRLKELDTVMTDKFMDLVRLEEDGPTRILTISLRGKTVRVPLKLHASGD